MKKRNRSGIAFLKPLFKPPDPISHDRHLINEARQGGRVAARKLMRKYDLRVFTEEEVTEMREESDGAGSY